MQTIKAALATAGLRIAKFLATVVAVVVVYQLLPDAIQVAVVALTPFGVVWSIRHYYRLYDPDIDGDDPLPSWKVLLVAAALMVWSLRVIWLGFLSELQTNPQLVASYLCIVTVVASYTVWLWIEEATVGRALVRTWQQRHSGSWIIWGRTADHGNVISQSATGSFNSQMTGDALRASQSAYEKRLADEAQERREALERTRRYEQNLGKDKEE